MPPRRLVKLLSTCGDLIANLLSLVGNLRFRAPQPPVKVSGVQQADTDPQQCYQASFGAAAASPFRKDKRDVTSTSEDCLFLK